MRNRKLVALLAVILVLSLAAMGCAGSASKQKTEQKAQQQTGSSAYLRAGGASPSAPIYTFCVVMSELVAEKNPGMKMNVQATAGSSAHYVMIQKGEIDLGSGSTFIDNMAYHGKGGPFKSPNDSFSAMLPAAVSYGQVVVPKDSSISKMSDLNGKKIGVGPRGSPTSMMVEVVIKELGITPSQLVFSTFDEMVEAFKDNRLDVAFCFGGAPNSIFLDIGSAKPIKFVPFSPEEQKKLAGAFSPTEITSKQYAFVTTPVPTLRDLQTILVSNKLPDDVVYKLTKTMMDNWDSVVKIAPAAGAVSYKDAVHLKTPLHPGAIKYYEEKGVKIPDELKKKP